jgi:hypothetical protein
VRCDDNRFVAVFGDLNQVIPNTGVFHRTSALFIGNRLILSDASLAAQYYLAI